MPTGLEEPLLQTLALVLGCLFCPRHRGWQPQRQNEVSTVHDG
jgi:hypothetical protein